MNTPQCFSVSFLATLAANRTIYILSGRYRDGEKSVKPGLEPPRVVINAVSRGELILKARIFAPLMRHFWHLLSLSFEASVGLGLSYFEVFNSSVPFSPAPS